MSGDMNGVEYSRVEKMEQRVTVMESDIKALGQIAASIDKLTTKIDTLLSTHLKIIQWLLIIVSTAFVGTKAAELFNMIH